MGRISPCWASSFARGGKGTKTPPGTAAGKVRKISGGGNFFLRFCAASPRTPFRESRRPCVVRTWQNIRTLTLPFASQNGEDFTGDKQYSPPRWRQRLTAGASYPPGPPGPPRRCLRSAKARCRKAGSSVLAGAPRDCLCRGAIKSKNAGTNFTVAERQRAEFRKVSCLLSAPNKYSVYFLMAPTRGPGPKPRGSLGTFHPWKVPRRRLDKP